MAKAKAAVKGKGVPDGDVAFRGSPDGKPTVVAKGSVVPEGDVALRGSPEGKSEGILDGDVALRGSPDGKPKTAAEIKAAKQARQDRYRRNCETFVKWDHMKSTKVYSADEVDDEGNLTFEWHYACAVCLAKRMKITEAAAMAEILSTSASAKAAEKRHIAFKTKLEDNASLMPALADSKKGRKMLMQITRDAFKEMWAPLFDAICEKTRHMFMISAGNEERKRLLEELKGLTDRNMIKEVMDKLSQLEASERLVGFSKHDEETQDRFQLAATYSDEWVRGDSKSGGFFWVRMYWICQKRTHHTRWEGNKQGRCLSMTMSKKWHQNVENDPLSEFQSWTCECQRWAKPTGDVVSEGKFRAGHGVVVEMKVPGIPEICYVRAEAPDDHVNDVRAIHYEKHLNPTTPEELYSMVPAAAPHLTQVIKKHSRWADWFEISPEDFDALPEFDWWSIFSTTGMTFERGLTKAQAKVQKDAAWGGEWLAKYNQQLDEFRAKEQADKLALEKWRQQRVGSSASASSTGR